MAARPVMGVLSLLRLLCSLRYWEDLDDAEDEPGPARHHVLSLSGFI